MNMDPVALRKLFNDLARAIAILHLASGRASEETRRAILDLYGPETVDRTRT
jgi:hypothetical protein